jgi:hypothetical protein
MPRTELRGKRQVSEIKAEPTAASLSHAVVKTGHSQAS